MEFWDMSIRLHRCLECGSHVTPQFRRGFGDERDRAHRCNECDSYSRLSEGSAAGLDVGLPDPLDDPSRLGEAVEELPSGVRAAIEARSVAADGGTDR